MSFTMKNCKHDIFNIQKKARRELRLNKYFTNKEKVIVIDDDSKESKFILCILDEIFNKRLNVGVAKKFNFKNNKINKIIIPWSLDKEINSEILNFFENKKLMNESEKNINKKGNNKIIKLFKTIDDDEIVCYLSTKRVPFHNSGRKNSNEFIDSLEKLYPGTKNTMLKSLANINK